jgi:hypothetical protein
LCKNDSAVDFSLLYVEINISIRVYL